MLLSANWLKKYIPDFTISDSQSFRHRVDTRLSEVAAITQKGEGLAGLFTAKIVGVEKHPSSDKLQICAVDCGDGEILSVVCGAPNARAELITILCKVGGSVYAPDSGELVEITKREVKGVESNGMLCSSAELGLNDSHQGIIELPPQTKIGENVVSLFKDTIIEIENKAFPHRPDLFSHLGMAREMSAIFKLEFKQPQAQDKFTGRSEKRLPLQIDIKDKAHCHRMSAVALTGVRIEPSPLWLQIQLSYADVRPINNIVDITNYIMLDIGQPMHAFDYHRIKGQKLIVRRAQPEEKLQTLDGKTHKLTPEMTVVADMENASSLAGIMGGAGSEIGETTQDIVLEAANWEMYQIRRTSRALGIRTEASTRFEKGMSAAITAEAIVTGANLIFDMAGGEVASELQDIYPEPETPATIKLNLSSVADRLGIRLSKADLIDILKSLQLEIANLEKLPVESFSGHDIETEIEIIAPLWRKDLLIPADILEEIGRLFGYENVAPTLPKRTLVPPAVDQVARQRLEIKKLLAASGLNEIYTYSMVGEELYKNCLLTTRGLLEIQSPISPELAFIRDTMTPSLLEKAQINNTKFANFGLFEVSRIATNSPEGELPKQPFKLAACFVDNTDELAYRKLKLSLENLNSRFGGQIELISTGNKLPPFLHPGKSAAIMLNDEFAGYVGIVHPQVLANLEFSKVSVAIYELDLDILQSLEVVSKSFQAISKYPAVLRDLSFWQAPDSTVGEAITAVKEANISMLESVTIIDTFSKDGKHSFTLRLTLQPTDKTLTSEEVDEEVAKAINALTSLGHTSR